MALEQAKIEKETAYELLEEDFKEILEHLKKEPVDKEKLKVLHGCLKAQLEAFQEVHKKYQDLLLKASNTAEYKVEKELEKKILRHKVDIELQYKKHYPDSSGGGGNQDPYHVNLPKRELVKHNGDVRKWLAFWASFQEIHDDNSIPEIEKFNYLVQATVPNSPAHEVVSSFPLQAKNYGKAIKRLHERFGRPKMLIKVYVRDLLRLVIDNSTGKNHDFVSLVTQITSQIRNLESLGVTQNKCAEVLYPVVETCLPDDVLQAWQRHSSFTEDLAKLMDFLEEVNNKTDRSLAQSFVTKAKPPKEEPVRVEGGSRRKSTTPTAAALITGEVQSTQRPKPLCVFCDKPHPPESCHTALDMGPDQKRDIVIRKGHCLACLVKGHAARVCRARVECIVCRKRHHTIMCLVFRLAKQRKAEAQSAANPQPSTSNSQNQSETTVPAEFQSSTSAGPSVHSLANQTRTPEVPLQILVVMAYGTNGKRKIVRAVMDTGSQRSYVTTALAEELQLPVQGQEKLISNLFGGTQTSEFNTPITKLMISKVDGANLTMFNVSSVDIIVRDTPATSYGHWITDFQTVGVQISDVNSTSQKIDILIGDDVAAKIYTGRIQHLSYGPSAMETKFGWALCGKLPVRHSSAGTLLISTLVNADRPVSDLWALETIGILDSAAKVNREEIEENALQHFQETVTQNEEGRYEVELPFLEGTRGNLSSNYDIAERRLRFATNKIKKDNYLEAYDKVFKQWELDSMIEPVTEEAALGTTPHYLPHRAVIKATSTTTPIRPVFDASAKQKGGYSLNECLEKGPNLLELIPDILIRFRLFQVGVISDIKKAFQMISVKPDHRDYLRFLWWEDLTCRKVKIFRHTRVVFGVSSSPFLLGATLQHVMKKADETHQATAIKLAESMYVDNCVASFPTTAAAEEFQQQSQELLAPAHFDLRGWEYGPSSEEKIIPVLGLIWKSSEDVLQIDISSIIKKTEMESTKRNVLSLCHMLFDPLGFIAPFSLQGKVLLRRCHEQKLGWDTPLPPEFAREFEKWKFQISEISDVKIPRHVHYLSAKKSLHIFCDASSVAYAAAIFLRVESVSSVEIQLLFAKARVSPQKEISIPRLELLSCLIAARLLKTVQQSLPNEEIPYFMWSDSSTALAWIKGQGPWGVFVQNRVNEVKTLTEVDRWFHIPGEDNPADLPSRGSTMKKLISSR